MSIEHFIQCPHSYVSHWILITTEACYIWKAVDRGGGNKKCLFHEENDIDDITNSIPDECFNFFFSGEHQPNH